VQPFTHEDYDLGVSRVVATTQKTAGQGNVTLKLMKLNLSDYEVLSHPV